ncbi:hypothetical protein HNY42_14685 [Exiguobacterium sp. Helios]|nr:MULTISPECIES: hypothetical protein [unclassified Exiguobacterium]QNR22137.1 hypothetical protein HNY42_14685 [Exiguobacterium sp. Helios]
MNLTFKESRRTMTSYGWCLNVATVSVAPLASREMDRIKPTAKRELKTS